MGYATGRNVSALICWYTSSTYCTRCGISSRGAVIISWRGAVFRDARRQRTARGARGVCGAVFRDTADFCVDCSSRFFFQSADGTDRQTDRQWKTQLLTLPTPRTYSRLG